MRRVIYFLLFFFFFFGKQSVLAEIFPEGKPIVLVKYDLLWFIYLFVCVIPLFFVYLFTRLVGLFVSFKSVEMEGFFWAPFLSNGCLVTEVEEFMALMGRISLAKMRSALLRIKDQRFRTPVDQIFNKLTKPNLIWGEYSGVHHCLD